MKRFLPLAALALIGAATAPDATDPATLSADVRTLSSPAFEGRSPGTPGETRTIAWLVQRFTAMGLQPGGPNGSWTQAVPLIHTRIAAGQSVTIGGTAFTPGLDVNLTTVRAAGRIAIARAPLVFVGYGVKAAEAGWDDFKGADLKGKVAVFLVNDPDFEATSSDGAFAKFGGG